MHYTTMSFTRPHRVVRYYNCSTYCSTSSYASAASVWLVNYSSLAIALAKECPYYWYRATWDEGALTAIWLNLTIITTECIDKSFPRGCSLAPLVSGAAQSPLATSSSSSAALSSVVSTYPSSPCASKSSTVILPLTWLASE